MTKRRKVRKIKQAEMAPQHLWLTKEDDGAWIVSILDIQPFKDAFSALPKYTDTEVNMGDVLSDIEHWLVAVIEDNIDCDMVDLCDELSIIDTDLDFATPFLNIVNEAIESKVFVNARVISIIHRTRRSYKRA